MENSTEDAAARTRGRPGPRAADLLERIVTVATGADGADLVAVAEVVGRGPGATSCRLELCSDEARPRYGWPTGGTEATVRTATVRLPIRYAGAPIARGRPRLLRRRADRLVQGLHQRRPGLQPGAVRRRDSTALNQGPRPACSTLLDRAALGR
jgi:hypothetical protein